MDSCNSCGGNMDIGGAVSKFDLRQSSTLTNRIDEEKQQNRLSGATIRKIKQLINKFNNFHNDDKTKKFNKYERHKYKLLYEYERHELKPRIETINDLYRNLATIQQMGFTLYYYIDDDNPENNDYLYCLEYGQLRGDRVSETFKYDRLDYKTIKDHEQIYKFAMDRMTKLYDRIREQNEEGLDRWATVKAYREAIGDEEPYISRPAPRRVSECDRDPEGSQSETKKEKEYKFHLNGFNFTADDLGRNLILQYMADKRQQPPIAIF